MFREVRLDSDVLVVDVARGWQRAPRLVDTLGNVVGITAVRDTTGRPLTGSIDTTSR